MLLLRECTLCTGGLARAHISQMMFVVGPRVGSFHLSDGTIFFRFEQVVTFRTRLLCCYCCRCCWCWVALCPFVPYAFGRLSCLLFDCSNRGLKTESTEGLRCCCLVRCLFVANQSLSPVLALTQSQSLRRALALDDANRAWCMCVCVCVAGLVA